MTRIVFLYAVAAVLSGFVAFLVFSFLYEPFHALVSVITFVAGAGSGAFIVVAAKRGWWASFRSRVGDAIHRPVKAMTH